LVQVDHAHLDHVVGRGRAVLEGDPVAEHEAILRRELQLVVVAKPMEPRPARNLADRRKPLVRGGPQASGTEESAGRGRRQDGLKESSAAAWLTGDSHGDLPQPW